MTGSRRPGAGGRGPGAGGRAIPLILLLAAVLFSGCTDGRRGVVEVELSGSLDDLGPAGISQLDLGSMRGVLQLFYDISRDDEVSGVLVRIGGIGGGPARLEEVRAALLRLRESGRTVHCHLEVESNFTYWLAATSCERVTLSPAGAVELVGLASESFYLREMLDSIGVRADVLKIGTHKGAAEFLTHEEMSPETREVLEEVLEDYTGILVQGVAQGRELEPAQVRELMDHGPFAPELARERGLVDALEYHDQSREHLIETLPGEAEELERYTKRWQERHSPGLLPLLAGEGGVPVQGERVAVLYLSGAIVGGEGGGMMGDRIALPRVRRAIEEIREEEQIRAVVVRIDSPGGSARASDEIWHALMELRSDRPIVASMGDVAASGGYYIATASNKILAQPGTITGSIGVVGGKVVLGGLMDEVGVNPELIKRGDNAGLAAISQPFTPGQRRALERVMESIYDRFVHCVVQGREMEEERVRALATGRVWTGRRALELGLIDELGGLHDAIALARELADLPEDAPVQAFPRPIGLLEQLERAMDPPSPLGALGLAAPEGSPTRELTLSALDTAYLLQDEQVLTLWPMFIQVR